VQDNAGLSPYALDELHDYLLIFQDDDTLGLTARLDGDRLEIMSGGQFVGVWRCSGTSMVFEGEPPTCVRTLQAAVLHTLSALAAHTSPTSTDADVPLPELRIVRASV
jgi:hypothetical protein